MFLKGSLTKGCSENFFRFFSPEKNVTSRGAIITILIIYLVFIFRVELLVIPDQMPDTLLFFGSFLIFLCYLIFPRKIVHAQRAKSPGKELRIFNLNSYLIPWFYVYKLVLQGDKFAIGSCRDQHERARAIAKVCKQYDVSVIQEVWGGGSHELQRAVETTHNIIPRYRAWGGLFGTGFLADLFNSALGSLRKNGGLWFASCPSSAPVIWSHHHTFNHKEGEEFMDKSANFILLDLSNKWGPGYKLLIVSTHLHSPEPFAHTMDRKKQREEILNILNKLPDQLEAEGIQVNWSNCGAVLLGDLNTACCIKGDQLGKNFSTEYLETLEVFKARDLFLENDSFKPEHRGKFSYDGYANEYVSPKSKQDSSRMDYALALTSVGSRQVMKFRAVDCKIMDDTLVSDHWPISLTLVPDEDTE